MRMFMTLSLHPLYHVLQSSSLAALFLYVMYLIFQYRRLFSRYEHVKKITGQVVHDIRSPLCALDILLRFAPIMHEEKLKLANDAVNHIRYLTDSLDRNDLLQQNDALSTIHVHQLITQVISDRELVFRNHNIHINYQYSQDCDSFYINAVEYQFKSIMINLINNAFEAMPKHMIDISLSKKDDYVMLIISDDGIGLTRKIQRNLFCRGFSTKKHGSGLGLSHAKEHIERWGGSITIKQNETSGTSAIILLPIVK